MWLFRISEPSTVWISMFHRFISCECIFLTMKVRNTFNFKVTKVHSEHQDENRWQVPLPNLPSITYIYSYIHVPTVSIYIYIHHTFADYKWHHIPDMVGLGKIPKRPDSLSDLGLTWEITVSWLAFFPQCFFCFFGWKLTVTGLKIQQKRGYSMVRSCLFAFQRIFHKDFFHFSAMDWFQQKGYLDVPMPCTNRYEHSQDVMSEVIFIFASWCEWW